MDDFESGESILKTDILVVLAHPDDEAGMATTLAHYAHIQGKRITNVYCTKGEGGGNMIGRQWGPSLGLVREIELKKCLSTLGVYQTHFLNQRDWAYTESAQMTLEAWDKESALESLVRIIRATRPAIILTMNPTPNPGQHGHHQAAGILAVEAFRLASSPEAYPQHIHQEGLEPWATQKLYISNSPQPYGATIKSTALLESGESISKIAGLALSQHKSQGFGRMANAPWMARPRTYQLLLSSVGFEENEKDLFERINPSIKKRATSFSHDDNVPDLRFENRPAMERFYNWSLENNVPVLGNFSSVNLSIPKKRKQTINLLATGTQSIDWKSVKLFYPKEWQVSLLPHKANISSCPIEVYIPDSSQSAAMITAKTQKLTVSAIVKPTPHQSINAHKTSKEPSTRFQWPDWEKSTSFTIPSKNSWQGTPTSDKDISGVGYVTWDKTYLYLKMDVTDDKLITNIAPNDARGHWRSDSVEICIDPEGGAEHTLGCFKAGIFPFTLSGGVSGSRDADANQGPFSETAKGMVLGSEKTDSGYLILSAIPWRIINIKPHVGTHFGFNLLIYDGDKEDAQPGENIGKSRLAWSPQRGVQGRPEDWGRITLR